RSDLRELWRQGIVRDYVSAALGGVTLTAPYLDPRVVELARAAPAELKVRGSERKVLLRGAARLASVPEEVWRAEKRAAQYSTGVEKVVRRWLRRTVYFGSQWVRGVERFEDPLIRRLKGPSPVLPSDIELLVREVAALKEEVKRIKRALAEAGIKID
ncbi:MAG: asparagine synthase C-terminal domain-containing protein, partial [Aigarchaeota archaeon]|nr:asparagine synthase C-terminal domain-containing protein [Aigarchaeota archaeon]